MPGITEPCKHHHHLLLLDHHIASCYDCNVKGHLSVIFAVDPFYRPFGRLSVTGPGVEPLLRVLWGAAFFALSLFYIPFLSGSMIYVVTAMISLSCFLVVNVGVFFVSSMNFYLIHASSMYLSLSMLIFLGLNF